MRVGTNPGKETLVDHGDFVHQVIVPVFIPDSTGYYERSFEVFRICLESLYRTVHSRTWITVVDNGCMPEIAHWIDSEHQIGRIHEVIHAGPIGKPNAIIKGLAGNNLELVTICDADVFFLSGWQNETQKIFSRLPQAGVVGLVPQFKMFPYCCANVIYDHLFSRKLKFLPAADKNALHHYYRSIGWENLNPAHLEYQLGLDYGDLKALVGSGHFVATYKRDIFDQIRSYFPVKLGKGSVLYFDAKGLEKDYWRLTTYGNFAFHMGNVPDPELIDALQQLEGFEGQVKTGFASRPVKSLLRRYLKDKVFARLIKQKFMYPLFLRKFGLPKEYRSRY